jgi:predicted acylesterase/phospholipase RssA
MADPNTIRVLSLDGGGIRGIISATFLELFCTQAGIPEDKLWQTFDIITGTSIGGIQALGYALGFTPTYLKNLLLNKGPTIFDAYGLGQAGYLAWSAYLTGVDISLYKNQPLIDLTTENFKTFTLQNMKTNVLIPSFKRQDASGSTVNIPVYFSNISNALVPSLSGYHELAANVALATSAAPVYFPPAVFNGETYVDGGLFLNNPAAMALSVMKAVKPRANRFCVLSVGTGLGSIGYIPNEPTLNGKGLTGVVDNLNTIKMVMDVAMAIPPESVSKEFELLANYTLENCYYYRMQYPIPSDQNPDSSLDNASDAFMEYMQLSATDYFNANIQNISTFIGHLWA